MKSSETDPLYQTYCTCGHTLYKHKSKDGDCRARISMTERCDCDEFIEDNYIRLRSSDLDAIIEGLRLLKENLRLTTNGDSAEFKAGANYTHDYFIKYLISLK